MARERLTFRQRDLAAALKAAKSAGIPVARIEVRQNEIVIIPGEPGTAAIIERQSCEAETDPDADPEILAAIEAVRNAKI